MKLRFSSTQDHQLAAVRSVVELFEGQPEASGHVAVTAQDDALFGLSSVRLTATGIANQLVLTPEQWLANCRRVQREDGLPESDVLLPLRLESGDPVGAFPNFTVEMETGTGKTYVYLRTIYELHKTYGFKKYVIVVPSVAIREGVLKNLQITREHFQTLYGHEPLHFSVYDSAKVNALRNFALSSAIQVLVINVDAFAKDASETNGGPNGGKKRKAKGNVINQLRETGVRPIEFLQAANPIVIVDEPQNFETDVRKAALGRLNPLCTLRYSATPRAAYNLVHRLDPVRAYELGLVKQISVDSVIEVKDPNQAYVELEGFRLGKRAIAAKLRIWVNGANGPEKRSVTVRNGDDLYALSNRREVYRDRFLVNEIDAREELVRFANNVTVYSGRPQGSLTEALLRLQIEATVRRHFEKARKLEPLGIKVLSVFFIDRVAHYRTYGEDGSVGKGKFAEWFEEIFAQHSAAPEFEGLYDFPAEKAHNGYFSQDRTAVSPYEVKEGKTQADAEASAFQLIMRDKERLLDPAEPLRFIFSHSALREGWDNPNVFQICTLAETSSELKKRQEIGRGLRLCVNAEGERVADRAVNRLTVIANESYEDFARQLQTELEEAGMAFRREMVQDERKKVTVRLRKGYEADETFLALWERIRQRTRYCVRYETARLVADAAALVRDVPPIERPRLAIVRAEIALDREGVRGLETGRQTRAVEARYVMPDFVAQVQGKTGLSRSTVAEILLRSGRLGDALANPQLFTDLAAEAIGEVKRALLVQGVEYARVDGLAYELRRFEDDDLMDALASNVVAVGKPDKTLFSHIIIDSSSGPERRFAEACEANEDVHFYLKLPRWFRIETPVGAYNPDWALVYRNDRTLYFVAETKDTGGKAGVDLALLRPLERLKIECGKRHFREFEEVRFRVVTSLEELVS
ncbi:MAG: DEAD/DEAH box helicase family protein [Deltaproteobacteria bacterium]|nr:DEAD/DEAH box helicase family protein [Deltaproteobacteria bacterium]